MTFILLFLLFFTYYLVEYNTQEEVCRVFECSRRSLMRWVEQYKKKGNIQRKCINNGRFKCAKVQIFKGVI